MGLIRPLKALKGPQGPFKALKSLIRPEGPYQGLKSLIRPTTIKLQDTTATIQRGRS